uniref:Uncharacterized protein n=1 Tax=Canis lupus familiaris TaxID=9615 RepID=A0A8I3PKI6_CANLF
MVEDIKTKIKNYQAAPFDSCFPNQNQTRNCWWNYLDFHHCEKAMSAAKGDIPCAAVSGLLKDALLTIEETLPSADL